MKEYYDFITLYWQLVKKYIDTDMTLVPEIMSHFADDFQNLCDKYEPNTPMRELVEEHLWSFLHFQEKTKGIYKA